MLLQIILPALFMFFTNSGKTGESKAPIQLLTQNSWMLVSAGLDENRNGSLDYPEESLRECEKNNRYTFFTDGTGLVEESNLQCGNGVSEWSFKWKLTDGNSALNISSKVVQILHLTENEFVIFHEFMPAKAEPLKFITVFRH